MLEFKLILAGISAAFSMFMSNKEINERKRKDVLNALTFAFIKTEIYYRKLNEGHSRDTDAEGNIALYWQAAADRIQDLDRSLSERLGAKSRYWLDGAWSAEAVAAADIDLYDINSDVREFIDSQRGGFE